MKIVIATDNYAPRYDGITRFLSETIPAIKQQHQVQVIAPNFGPTTDPWPVVKIPLSKFKVDDFTLARIDKKKVFEQVKDANILFLQTLGPIGLTALSVSKTKNIIYTHSIEWELIPESINNKLVKAILKKIIKSLVRIAYKKIDLLVVPSESLAAKYYFSGIKKPYRVVHLGVDIKQFKPAKNKFEAKKKVGLQPDELIIGYHGRLAHEKDLKTLLRGFMRFKRKHLQTNPKLLIVGDGLKSIRKELEDKGAVVTGFVPDVEKYLQAMDIYVLSSLTETSCLSVMEAMACGVAVVSTPAGYIKDYITHGHNGLLYPFKDSAQLAGELELLLDLKYRKKIGLEARKTIINNFSWDTTKKELLKVINHI